MVEDNTVFLSESMLMLIVMFLHRLEAKFCIWWKSSGDDPLSNFLGMVLTRFRCCREGMDSLPEDTLLGVVTLVA